MLAWGARPWYGFRTMSTSAATFPLLSHLSYVPRELSFGTSGLRGLARDMTDLEIYINVRGYLDHVRTSGGLFPGETIAIARDLREVDPTTGRSSSPRIARAVVQAIRDTGPFRVENCGTVPTPALAFYSLSRRAVGIMVTGSHIPADRNGVKFYKKDGEVLKSDEAGILAAVGLVRAREYGKRAGETLFDEQGMLKAAPPLDPPDPAAEEEYLARYLGLLERPLLGERLVCYQHSAVGRDLLVRLLEGLGATVIPVGRSDHFVPVDTEEVTDEDQARYRGMAAAHRPDAIVSTDGDGDRPLVIDETGVFHRGDALGILTAEFLGARFCAVPISTTDAVDRWAAGRLAAGEQVTLKHTAIGSPHVIRAMNEAIARGETGVVAWEANGGFLLGTDFQLNGGTLSALPTRDAVLPILAVLLMKRARDCSLSQLFATLPARATQAGLIDDFPMDRSRAVLSRLLPTDRGILQADFRADGTVMVSGADGGVGILAGEDPIARDLRERRAALWDLLARASNVLAGLLEGLGEIAEINYLDGVRAHFASGDVIHLRPSGNAPQMRVYSISDTRARADALVRLGTEAMSRCDGSGR